MALFSLSQKAPIFLPVVAPGHEQKCTANQDKGGSSQPHHIHGDGAIFARTRVVMIAKEQDLISGPLERRPTNTSPARLNTIMPAQGR
jgi:hypothetical protein